MPHLMIVIAFVLSASPPGLVFWEELESPGDLIKMQIHQIQVGKCKGRALTFCIFNSLVVLMLLICQPHLGSKDIDGLFHLQSLGQNSILLFQVFFSSLKHSVFEY